MLSVVMLNENFIYCYAECHYSECRYAECRGAPHSTVRSVLFSPWILLEAEKLFCRYIVLFSCRVDTILFMSDAKLGTFKRR
jgi:hypothetical protein